MNNDPVREETREEVPPPDQVPVYRNHADWPESVAMGSGKPDDERAGGEAMKMWRITVAPKYYRQPTYASHDPAHQIFVVAAPDRDMAIEEAERRYRTEVDLRHSFETLDPILVERFGRSGTRVIEADSGVAWWRRLFR